MKFGMMEGHRESKEVEAKKKQLLDNIFPHEHVQMADL